METRTLEQVEQEIAETKAALQNVHGTETEVYARIVGYYRAVKNWNKGKRDEFEQRKMFSLPSDIAAAASYKQESKNITAESTASTETAAFSSAPSPSAEQTPSAVPSLSEKTTEASMYFEMYTRKTCPNCPPVKAFMESSQLPGQAVDVDTDDGLAQAARKGVCATPTVIFYNEAGVEQARCHNVEELEAVLNKVAVIA